MRRALKILADREVSPQIGLLKSTLLQLDSTFSERNYGASSFRDFVEKLAQAGSRPAEARRPQRHGGAEREVRRERVFDRCRGEPARRRRRDGATKVARLRPRPRPSRGR